MRAIFATVSAAAVSLTVAAGTASAAGPMYDVNAMFNEPHPFEGDGWATQPGAGQRQYQAPQYQAPQYQPPQYQPPPQPLQYQAPAPQPVAQASSRPAPRPAPARQPMAAGRSPWYLDFGLSYVMVADADLSTGGTTGELSADAGYGGSLALGYNWRDNIRFDIEATYRDSDLDAISVGGFGFTGNADVDGSVSSLAVMVNGYYDADFGWAVTPYVGAGIGAAQITVDSSTLSTDDSDTVLAYQGTLGLSYEISSQLSARLAYKLFMTSDPEIKNTESEYMANNVELGLSYRF